MWVPGATGKSSSQLDQMAKLGVSAAVGAGAADG